MLYKCNKGFEGFVLMKQALIHNGKKSKRASKVNSTQLWFGVIAELIKAVV